MCVCQDSRLRVFLSTVYVSRYDHSLSLRVVTYVWSQENPGWFLALTLIYYWWNNLYVSTWTDHIIFFFFFFFFANYKMEFPPPYQLNLSNWSHYQHDLCSVSSITDLLPSVKEHDLCENPKYIFRQEKINKHTHTLSLADLELRDYMCCILKLKDCMYCLLPPLLFWLGAVL